jgi:hypothetical protein
MYQSIANELCLVTAKNNIYHQGKMAERSKAPDSSESFPGFNQGCLLVSKEAGVRIPLLSSFFCFVDNGYPFEVGIRLERRVVYEEDIDDAFEDHARAKTEIAECSFIHLGLRM